MEYLQSNDSEADTFKVLLRKVSPGRFCYDAMIISPINTLRRYRMSLDTRTDKDIMDADIYHRIEGAKLQPYQGSPIAVPGGLVLDPLGTIVIKWHFNGGKRLYETTFLVVNEAKFDMLLGNTSIDQVKEEALRLEGEFIHPRKIYTHSRRRGLNCIDL